MQVLTQRENPFQRLLQVPILQLLRLIPLRAGTGSFRKTVSVVIIFHPLIIGCSINL